MANPSLVYSGHNILQRNIGSHSFVKHVEILHMIHNKTYSSLNLKLPEALGRIRVTQGFYGGPRVRYLRKKFSQMDSTEVNDYLAERPVPCIEGPGATLYIFDRHHTLYSLAIMEGGFSSHELLIPFNLYSFETYLTQMGKKPTSMLDPIDLKEMTESEFISLLNKSHLAYLKDLEGNKLDSNDFRKSLLELEESFYRGLAWIIRKAGGFQKTKIPFAEFLWADFLRENLRQKNLAEEYSSKLIELAVELALNIEFTKKASLPGRLEILPAKTRELNILRRDIYAKAMNLVRDLKL